MLRLGVRALTVDLGPWIGAVELDVLDCPALYNLRAALGVAGVFEPDEDLVLDLHVPRVIVFAGLNDRARRRHGVAAALHLDHVEIGPVGDMISGVALASDEVARFELDEPVRAGSYRLQVCRSIARIRAFVGLEQMFWNDHAEAGDKRGGPEGRRLFEQNAHGERIDL